MALDFPTGVTINYIHSTGGRSWIWNGFGWDSYNRGVTGIQGPQGLPGVTGAQGATGASPTDYVAFVNGLKGVVGLSAGVGILLGTSGNTFIITNTGVTSINGSTGAIANVAFTNAANNFSVLQVMAAGLSASGITLTGSLVLENQEFIRGFTNGRIDLMPAPFNSSSFGLYVDTTTWGFGVDLGAVRSSDNNLTSGGLRFRNAVVMSENTDFSFNSSQTNRTRYTTTGLGAWQLIVPNPNASLNSSIAIVAADGAGAANRVPNITNSNPNLFIYASGSASPNHFIRFTHNGGTGNIITGAGSELQVIPGSSMMSVIGGVSAFGATFANGLVIGTGVPNASLGELTPSGVCFIRSDNSYPPYSVIKSFGSTDDGDGGDIGHGLALESARSTSNTSGSLIELRPGGTAIAGFRHDGAGGTGFLDIYNNNGFLFYNDFSIQYSAYHSSNFGNKISDPLGNIVQNPHGMITSTISNLVDFGSTGGYRLFLLPFFFDKKTEIRRIATVQGGTPVGHTGSIRFCVYGTSLGTGLPWTRQYQSSNINLNQVAFQRYAATPNIIINPGTYWIGFVLDMVAKTGPTYSWGIISNCSDAWEDYSTTANRLFNNGQLNHLRYGMTAMDCPTPFSGTSFTSAYAYSASPSASPATAGFGVSEMYSGSRCPWVGISVRQFGSGMNG